MEVVSFMNMKGGVGKTTLAVNVAFTLAAVHEKRVLMVDVDPQFNATQYLVQDDRYLSHISDNSKGTIRDVFVPRSLGAVNTTTGLAKPQNKAKMDLSACILTIYDGAKPGFARGGKGRLDLLPSTLDLVEIQTSPRKTEDKLKHYLKEKAAHYDYVILDCPPTISIFTEAAILASDKYVVPMRPDPLSVLGLPLLERYIHDYTADAGQKLEQIGIIFSLVRTPTPTAMKNIMNDLRKARKSAVFESMSTLSTHVAESVEYHRPMIYFNKASSKVKEQYLKITAEFLKRAEK
ncbi:ParA family protein [Mesorhizobium sp. M0140]|uniref:ParA family protein n=1 Tax=Mesorhizobium sp. M0140 TaxID=2956893 RepID=UPI00333D1C8A